MLAYVARERNSLISVGDLSRTLAAAEFAKAAGFLRKQAGCMELLVPAAWFQREFPAHVAIMRELRGAWLAAVETPTKEVERRALAGEHEDFLQRL